MAVKRPNLATCTLVMAFILLPPLAPAAAPKLAFDGRLEGATATVLFQGGDEAHAARVLDTIARAQRLVSGPLPNDGRRVRVYLYGSAGEMALGVKTILGYGPEEVSAVLKVGITEQSDYTLHLHPKTALWGSRLTHVIVDEHIHGILREKYSVGPSANATWVEEGLTSYLAHRLLAGEPGDYEENYPDRRFRVAFAALLRGKLPTLDEIATRSRWYRNINASVEAWDTQYALAYFAVSHLVGNYGFNAALEVLSHVAEGQSCRDSLQRVTGIEADEFEAEMRSSLLYTGFFDLYLTHTLLLVMLLAITAWTLIPGNRGY